MTRHILFGVVLLGAVAGCNSGKPISYFSLTPRPSGDAYTCAVQKVNELGYTVTNTNREAGFITADKQTTGAMRKALTGQEFHDQLTVSVSEDAPSQKRKLRVTAAATTARTTLFNTSTSSKSPSDEAVADANAILAACAEGTITRQARVAGLAGAITVE